MKIDLFCHPCYYSAMDEYSQKTTMLDNFMTYVKEESCDDTAKTFKKPCGRPPKGKVWNPYLGKWENANSDNVMHESSISMQ